ncbi:MAG TPA: alpha/beta fold hydrolase, partial [Anaerolineales bacterium]|nr:alpha/beta fold hydrolase [Anaerolineales bacterium]
MGWIGSSSVPGPSDTELKEFEGWTLRLRPSASDRPRPLLLIHGWTGDENSMWVFTRHLPADYWIVAPRAPYATKPSGYSWRVGYPGRDSSPGVEDLRPSGERLLGMLDRVAKDRGLDSPTWNVMGFSQGAVMAATLALLFPQRVGRVAMLAGFMPRGAESLVGAQPLRAKAVFVSHG